MNIIISPSTNLNKKYKAVIDGRKTIHFGHSQYEDFTTHNDSKRRDNYIARTSKQDHSKQNVASPAWMSRFILWEKPTLKGVVESANKKYKDINIKIK
jgi:hypothetical protein